MTVVGSQLDPMDPLAVIASPPPGIDAAAVQHIVRQDYGLEGDWLPLVSERDQKFLLTTAQRQRFIVKIANAAEPEITTDFQIRALLHIEKSACTVKTPRMIRTVDGRLSIRVVDGDNGHLCRIVTYVPGIPADEIAASTALAKNLGASLARIDKVLMGFEHEGNEPVLLWDMQRTSALRGLLPCIAGLRLRQRVEACVNDFDRNVLPSLPALRRQVIHGDLNPGNVLIEDDTNTVAGVIDFGDMVRAPLIADVAIAAAYLRADNADPLRLILPFVAGFNAAIRLERTELELLFDLVRARLAATITIENWRITARGEADEYSRASVAGERAAPRFLQALDTLSRAAFTAGVLDACES